MKYWLKNKKKHTLIQDEIVLALGSTSMIGLLGFAGIQMASAHGGYAQGGGYGDCRQYYDGDNTKDNVTWEEFRAETNDIRKSISC
jgi:hypothetical protein